MCQGSLYISSQMVCICSQSCYVRDHLLELCKILFQNLKNWGIEFEIGHLLSKKVPSFSTKHVIRLCPAFRRQRTLLFWKRDSLFLKFRKVKAMEVNDTVLKMKAAMATLQTYSTHTFVPSPSNILLFYYVLSPFFSTPIPHCIPKSHCLAVPRTFIRKRENL